MLVHPLLLLIISVSDSLFQSVKKLQARNTEPSFVFLCVISNTYCSKDYRKAVNVLCEGKKA